MHSVVKKGVLYVIGFSYTKAVGPKTVVFSREGIRTVTESLLMIKAHPEGRHDDGTLKQHVDCNVLVLLGEADDGRQKKKTRSDVSGVRASAALHRARR